MHRDVDVCEKCNSLKKKKRETKFGDFKYVCGIFDVGRNLDSESCDRYE